MFLIRYVGAADINHDLAARMQGPWKRLDMTTDFDSVDYFTDPSLVPDPRPYFDHIRSEGPYRAARSQRGFGRTGWETANAVYKDSEATRPAFGSRARSRRSRSCPKVTTSARSWKSAVPNLQCSSTWSRWIHRTTRCTVIV